MTPEELRKPTTKDWPSLLHAVGHGDRSGIPASRTKSISLTVAFDRVRSLLKPNITVTNQAFELVSAARNGVAHIGAHDVRAARAVLGTCIKIATPILTELRVDQSRYWGHHSTALIEQLVDEQATEVRVTVEAKLARAKRTFQQRFGEMTPEQRAGVVAAIGATRTGPPNEELQVDCPACECLGWLHGETVLDWTVNPVNPQTGRPDPVVVFYSDRFACAGCGLELEGDEFDHTNLEPENYLDDEDPSPYITNLDEDFAYESWRDDQLTEL